jgi:phosphatidylserine/phosphatidylglycerophosphate/cardiolipin synthase-like enzyme
VSDLDDITFSGAPAGRVELVMDGEHLRRVIYDGVLKARVSVDIATADLKSVLVPDPGKTPSRRATPPSMLEHLCRIAQRGVEVRVLHAGVPSGLAIQELKKLIKKHGELPTNLVLRRCPRLHAKAVILDADRMYLGSANLTGAGLGAKADRNRNHELGVWTTSHEMIDAVSQYFNHLWEGGACEGCGRRDVCPVPLEEPKL